MKKTALITGASSGIGKELAVIHAATGGDVIIVARSLDKLNALKSQLETNHNIRVHVYAVDLTDSIAVNNLYNDITAAGLQVDYLINNAGHGGIGKFHKRDWQDEHSMILLNVVALTQLCNLFLPDFIKRNSGAILNVSSTASLMPGPWQAVYFATKAFVTSLSNAISQEIKDTAVTVTNLMPGATDTDFGKVSGMDKTASATTVAQAGYDAMLAGKMDIIAGLSFPQKLMMTTLPITPKKIKLAMVEKMQEPRN